MNKTKSTLHTFTDRAWKVGVLLSLWSPLQGAQVKVNMLNIFHSETIQIHSVADQ